MQNFKQRSNRLSPQRAQHRQFAIVAWWLTPRRLEFGAAMFCSFALLFWVCAFWGGNLIQHFVVNDELVTRTDAQFVTSLKTWRIHMGIAGMSSAVLATIFMIFRGLKLESLDAERTV